MSSFCFPCWRKSFNLGIYGTHCKALQWWLLGNHTLPATHHLETRHFLLGDFPRVSALFIAIGSPSLLAKPTDDLPCLLPWRSVSNLSLSLQQPYPHHPQHHLDLLPLQESRDNFNLQERTMIQNITSPNSEFPSQGSQNLRHSNSQERPPLVKKSREDRDTISQHRGRSLECGIGTDGCPNDARAMGGEVLSTFLDEPDFVIPWDPHPPPKKPR